MKSINICQTVELNTYSDGTFDYVDTYGERHEFDSPDAVWAHLTDDGQEFSEEVRAFIFGDDA